YAFVAPIEVFVKVNRDVVPESRLSKVDQLLDPQWKGKIAFDDPRRAGSGIGLLSHFVRVKGEDFAIKLLQQDLVLARDTRQLADWLVRGTYPIYFGNPSALNEFFAQGLGKNVKDLEPEGGGDLETGSGHAALV